MVQHSSIDHSGLTGVVSSYGSNANDVGLTSAGGAATTASRGDHVHRGVASVTHSSNTWYGPVTIVAQGSIGITKTNDTTVAINAVAGTSGAGSSDLAGYEYDYVEKTTNTSITATTEGGADTIVTATAVVFDGTTKIVVDFYCAYAAPDTGAAGRTLILVLYDGASSIGKLAPMATLVSGNQSYITGVHSRRLTPSAASHTYSVRAYVSAGTGTVGAGAGGSGTYMPAFIRITKV